MNQMEIKAYLLDTSVKDSAIMQAIDKLLQFDLPISEAIKSAMSFYEDIPTAIANFDVINDTKEALSNIKQLPEVVQTKVDEFNFDLDAVFNTLINKINELYKSVNEITEEGAKASSKVAHTWVLPLPNNLTDMNTQRYESNDLTLTQRLMTKSSYILGKVFSPTAANAAQRATELGIQLGKRNNIVINPQRVTTFGGTELKRYTFTYNLIPESQAQYNNILKGIIALKYYMSGNADNSSLFMTQKAVFKIDFNNTHLNEMMENKGKEFNLTNIHVSYGADGKFSINSRGSVKHIQLSLSFVERKPHYNIEGIA